ncbi:short chain dehydrogenase [Nocardia brasiliensis ATCC] [Mycobacterium shimoidei]|uniref:Short chain dehydrogenase [Nocardia brasiliensis ATCC] n=1 Tax=Mycobacterium shimoidei TaxID=29313 RepID=A0A375YZT8_MYCSH|nr:SDR family NAD(P)-dependent oxidoreductase [Mycobacterium shimoidei]SRX94376.1 short chain dehydrogenase [Nocardia brasiliensis ATCC] [Mycobacterium shimoidei]
MASESRTNLRGRTVAVTGGARGIGRASAAAFSAVGARVAIGDLDAELAQKVATEIGGATGSEVVGLWLDVTDPGSFEHFFDQAEAALGPVDVLLNNAGIMPTGLFFDEDPAVTDRIIDINLRGVIAGSRLAMQRFVPRGNGVIINVASLAGVRGFPAVATYCATKHAVLGFSEALEAEVREHGVSVVVVLPGVVRTELSAGASLPTWMERLSTVDPDDVAIAILAAMRRGKFRVTVPGRLGVLLLLMSLMPMKLRRWADRIAGTGRAYVQADPVLRESYRHRIFGGGE